MILQWKITVEITEYDPFKNEIVNKQFTGEFEGVKSEAVQEALEFYAYEHDTTEDEIKLITVDPIE
jgi:hypothetical protein